MLIKYLFSKALFEKKYAAVDAHHVCLVTLQQTAIHCATLQRAAAHWECVAVNAHHVCRVTLQHIAPCCNTLKHTVSVLK